MAGSIPSHELVEIAFLSNVGGWWWVCSCGESGLPLGDIPTVCTGRDRAEGAFSFHRAQKTPADPWPFPSVRYDYRAAGVGMRSKPVDVSTSEIDEALAPYKYDKKPPGGPP